MATVPVEMTAVAGAVLTAAQWNSNVRDAINFLIGVPVFEGRQTVAQSIANATEVAVLFDVEDVDNDNGHSVSTNTSRYTAQTAGRWQLSGAMSYVANATGFRNCDWLVNGGQITSLNYNNLTAGSSCRIAGRTMTKFLNVGDYVEMGTFQTSGAALNTAVTANLEQATFSMRWVGTT